MVNQVTLEMFDPRHSDALSAFPCGVGSPKVPKSILERPGSDLMGLEWELWALIGLGKGEGESGRLNLGFCGLVYGYGNRVLITLGVFGIEAAWYWLWEYVGRAFQTCLGRLGRVVLTFRPGWRWLFTFYAGGFSFPRGFLKGYSGR